MAKRSFILSGNDTGIPSVCGQIRYYRILRGMEQKELSAALGITANSVSNWEQGRSRPDINLLPALCETLEISLYDLYSLPDPYRLNVEEREFLNLYRSLRPGNRKLLDGLASSMTMIQRAESIRDLKRVLRFDKPLAAGIGDPSEFVGLGEAMYLIDSEEFRRADYVFRICGDSMEPKFSDGDLVLVERVPSGDGIGFGEIGAFIVGNEMYIKIREKNGLRSLNPKYDLLRFDEEASVYLIGRVLTVLDPDRIATARDVELFRMLHE